MGILNQLIIHKPPGVKFNKNNLAAARAKFSQGVAFLQRTQLKDSIEFLASGEVNCLTKIEDKIDESLYIDKENVVLVLNNEYSRKNDPAGIKLIDNKQCVYLFGAGNIKWITGTATATKTPLIELAENLLKPLDNDARIDLLKSVTERFKEESYLMFHQKGVIEKFGRWVEVDGIFYSDPDFKSFKHSQKEFLRNVWIYLMGKKKDNQLSVKALAESLKNISDSVLEQKILQEKEGKVLLDMAYSLD